MNFRLHDAPGLKRQLILPDHIQYFVRLIPETQTNQRPGYLLWPDPVGVDHETGNTRPDTGAWNHSLYLDNGAMARDQYGRLYSQQLSYHTCSDENIIVQKIPFNEVTWQAACGACGGNYRGRSNEMAVSSNYDKHKCRDTAEWLRAAILEADNQTPDDAHLTVHYDWNGSDPDRHHCPDGMLNDNYLPTFRNNVRSKYAILRAHRESLGQVTPPPPPQPEYPKPQLPENFSITTEMEHPPDKMTYRGRRVYNMRRNFKNVSGREVTRLDRPATKSQGAKSAGPKLPDDAKIYGVGLWKNPDDNIDYLLDEQGMWYRASSFHPRVRIDARSADDR